MFNYFVVSLFVGLLVWYCFRNARSNSARIDVPIQQITGTEEPWLAELRHIAKTDLEQLMKDLSEPIPAFLVRSDMKRLFDQLRRDSAMSDANWREWLPYFEAADECYARSIAPDMAFDRLADKVRKILA